MMHDQPPFRTAGIVSNLKWLQPLRGHVRDLLTIGYMTSECFALKYLLSADTATILEIDISQFKGPMGAEEERELLEKQSPVIFPPGSVSLVVGDVTTGAKILAPASFDLVYCADMLYFLQDDASRVMAAINNMSELVRPGGWIVAVEPKFGASFEEQQTSWGPLPVRVSDPKDLSGYFQRASLIPAQFDEAPEWSYVYRRSK